MNDKVTIYTLADELNVSPSAVSRAFNPNSRLSKEKRQRILAAAEAQGFTPNRAAARLSRRDIRIGAVIVNRIPVFYRAMYDGIVDAAKELSSQKVTADIRLIQPGSSMLEQLFSVLDDFQNNEYDGIILHGIYNRDIIARIDELVDSDIPVVTLHNDLNTSRRLFNSTCNTGMAGAIAAELLSSFIHASEKKVVIFTGSMSSPIHQQLLLSFSTACTKEGVHMMQLYDTMDNPDFAERLVEKAFETYPDLNGIYISSANSVPICEYVVQNKLIGKVTIVASDTFPQLNDYIRCGVVAASLYQDPYHQGKNALINLYRYLAENYLPPQIIQANPQIVIRSNLSLYENY